jgi:hypothetical protein
MAWGIFIVWIISFVVDAGGSLLHIDYDPNPTIHGLMMVVAGSAFVAQALNKNGNGDSSG